MCCMESLPDELLIKILSQLSPYREQGIAAQVCTRWRNVTTHLMSSLERKFEKSLRAGNVEWYELENDDDSIKISSRQDMSVCYNDGRRSVYVFGGISSLNSITGFNDLLRLDMHTLRWTREPIRGVVPPPLSRCVLISYKDYLLLYSGVHLTEQHPFSRAGLTRVSNQLFTYDVNSYKWTRMDFLQDDCPPPMYEKASCVMVRDCDLEMDAFYLLGNVDRDSPKSLWSLDLHTFTWEEQTLLDRDQLDILTRSDPCQIYEINGTVAYSSALLVTSILPSQLHACLLLKTSYNEWRCQNINLSDLPNDYAVFFKRMLLSSYKIKDTLALLTVRPSASIDMMNVRCKVRAPKLLRSSTTTSTSTVTSPSQQPSLNLGPEFALAFDFITLFLLDLSDISKESSKLKWVENSDLKKIDEEITDTIKPSFTCKCNVKHGTFVKGRGELILIGEMRPRNTSTIPVYVLRKTC